MSDLIYLDENFIDEIYIDVLSAGAFDVLDAKSAGMLGRSDADQLAFATAHERLLVTFDRKDYFRLHGEVIQRGDHHAGILLVLRDAGFGPGEILRRMSLVRDVFRETGTRDQILFLSNFG